MSDSDILKLTTYCPVKTQNAGLFISRGYAMHPTRVIGSHELIFVKQGILDMWEEDLTFHVEAGQTLLLRPGRKHGSSKPMPPELRFYWIHFEVENHAADGDDLSGDEYTPSIKVPRIVDMPQPERLERLFRVFLEEQETGVLHPYTANLLTLLMLAEIMQALEEQSAEADELNAVATWAHSYIRMNYDRPITPTRVAEAIGYNTDYLGRIFQKTYGCTLTEAIHRRRVDVACQYLLDSNLTIGQIAQKCGFSDPDYFRRIFKRHRQVSPGNYRDEYSRVHINTH